MRAQPNRLEDKNYLKKLTEALNISEKRIKLDECGDWNIFGLRGKISTEGNFWYVYPYCETHRKWTSVKKKLQFMEVHQDGDSEGVLKLSRMPSRDEGLTIRKVIGLRPRTVLSEEERALLKIRFKSPSQMGVSADSVRLNRKEVVR